jgi:hypothetical protein
MSKLERALAGYDSEFEARLVDEITAAIVNASMVTAGNGHQVMALRLGECANALTTVLAATLALSPAAARNRSAIKQTADGFRRKLAAKVRAAEDSPDFHDFKSRCFHDGDRERGGNA